MVAIKKCVNCLQLAPFGCGELCGTNFYKFYGRFEEIGSLYIVPVSNWLYDFGLDVLSGIFGKFSVKKQILKFFLLKMPLVFFGKFEDNSNINYLAQTLQKYSKKLP